MLKANKKSKNVLRATSPYKPVILYLKRRNRAAVVALHCVL